MKNWEIIFAIVVMVIVIVYMVRFIYRKLKKTNCNCEGGSKCDGCDFSENCSDYNQKSDADNVDKDKSNIDDK